MSALDDALEMINCLFKFRITEAKEEGTLPFNTCDYYALDVIREHAPIELAALRAGYLRLNNQMKRLQTLAMSCGWSEDEQQEWDSIMADLIVDDLPIVGGKQ